MKRRFLWVAGVALAAGVGAFLWVRGRGSSAPPPSAAEMKALEAARDRLNERLRAVVVANGERSLGQAPPPRAAGAS